MIVPVHIPLPLGLALRIARETYETAALPLSYVGRSVNIADDFRQLLFPRSGLNGRGARIERYNARIADNCLSVIRGPAQR
jgi:hypothetical protein